MRTRQDHTEGNQQRGDHRRRGARQQGFAWQHQRQGTQHQQDGSGSQGRTTPLRWGPRLEFPLHHVCHRFDHVVVDALRLVVDSSRDDQYAAVRNPLDGQARVAGQDAAVLSDQAVAAIDRRRVEQADGASQFRHQLSDRDGSGKHQINPARTGGYRDSK